ncbi:hypothetical protein [Brevundimonas sp. M20]|uniref:hypothetical protein n=1 Tax=Brevundimonas sp. M20 TaxID=2591463 RepID=UPI001146A2C8|nr:hypothetical protein [Brevundimonas sp. M20]QDH72090.1 hypothetical protein FKQ52_00835 [Brevundimonas sp. M20]
MTIVAYAAAGGDTMEPKENLAEREAISPVVMRRRRRAVSVGALIIVAALSALLIPLAQDIITLLWGEPYDWAVAQFRFSIGVIGLSSAMIASAFSALGYLRDGTLNPFSMVTSGPHEPRIASGPRASEREAERPEAIPQRETPSEQLARELSVRLDLEIQNQDRKANLNLIIGGGGALLALAILVISVFLPPRAADPAMFWAVAGARAFLSLTASVFAFFFLSTYRRNLSESRYFHNELTNVEAKLLAIQLYSEVKLAKPDRGDATMLEMLKGLASTERNFILRKGETTTDLHQKDIDRQEHSVLLAALSALTDQPVPRKKPPVSPTRAQ